MRKSCAKMFRFCQQDNLSLDQLIQAMKCPCPEFMLIASPSPCPAKKETLIGPIHELSELSGLSELVRHEY